MLFLASPYDIWRRPCLFRDKTSETMENAVKNASSVENARTRQSIAASRNVLTVSGAIRRDERRASERANWAGGRARNFRASSRLTSSKTGKIYEKNACQRGMEFMKTLVSLGHDVSLPSRSLCCPQLQPPFLSLLPPYFSSIHFPRAELGARRRYM